MIMVRYCHCWHAQVGATCAPTVCSGYITIPSQVLLPRNLQYLDAHISHTKILRYAGS